MPDGDGDGDGGGGGDDGDDDGGGGGGDDGGDAGGDGDGSLDARPMLVRELTEDGARIALWVRYPGHPMFAATKAYSALVSNIDIAPTLIELATGQSGSVTSSDSVTSSGSVTSSDSVTSNPMDGVSLLSLASSASDRELSSSSQASYAADAFVNNR